MVHTKEYQISFLGFSFWLRLLRLIWGIYVIHRSFKNQDTNSYTLSHILPVSAGSLLYALRRAVDLFYDTSVHQPRILSSSLSHMR